MTGVDAAMGPRPALRDRRGRCLASPGPGDASPKDFLERLAREGVPLPLADLVGLVRDWGADRRALEAVRLDGADLRGCDASGLSLRGGSFRLCVLRNALLPGCDLRDADLSGAILDGASMPGADLRRAVLGIAEQGPGQPARHALRPETDEFVPFHRCLLRTADLSGADLRGARLFHADLSGAEMADADLRGALVERCNLDGTDLRGTRFDDTLVFRCYLSSPSLHEATAAGAVFRSNAFIEMPGPGQALDAGKRFPRQLAGYIRAEWRQRRALPREIRTDLDRMAAIRLLVVVPVPFLVSWGWRSLETYPLFGLLMTFGAATVFALRRYVTMAVQAGLTALLGRLHDAEGALRAGRPAAALRVLAGGGYAAEAIDARRRRDIHAAFSDDAKTPFGGAPEGEPVRAGGVEPPASRV